jgi:hypothetical protein
MAMRLGRLLSGSVLLGVVLGLPMCGSEDAKKRVVAAGGEGGEPSASAGTPSAGGSKTPGNDGGAGDGNGGASLGGGASGVNSAGAAGEASVVGGQGGAGPSADAGAAGMPGAGGVAAFCASDETSCCAPDEPSCDAGWPAPCGQNMDSHSCCDAGVRQTCSVEYFDANYHVLLGKQDCSCSSGSCECACVKGDACPYQEADCNSTSWTDACVLGSSPSCCDSANGVRQKCVYQAGVGKTFTSSPVIDACTGEGFGTGYCGSCLNGQDPQCDTAFFDACSSDLSHCSDATLGYRMSCQDGARNVVCTCDPSIIDF